MSIISLTKSCKYLPRTIVSEKKTVKTYILAILFPVGLSFTICIIFYHFSSQLNEQHFNSKILIILNFILRPPINLNHLVFLQNLSFWDGFHKAIYALCSKSTLCSHPSCTNLLKYGIMQLDLAVNLLHFLSDLDALYPSRGAPNSNEIYPWDEIHQALI
jgi:hypothetical protein